MTFLICGSSFTSGCGLDDRSQAWPFIFQNLCNQPVVNTAIDGGSVDYVIYNVIKDVSVRNYKNVIITWPPLGRTLLVRRENNYLINANPMFHHALYQNSEELTQFLKLFYKHWTNELYDLKFTLQKIVLLQNFLKSKGCQYLFINTNSYRLDAWLMLSRLSSDQKYNFLDAFDSMDDDCILFEEQEIKSYFDQLDFDHYYDPVNYNLMHDCCIKMLVDHTEHPTVDGHKYLANLIWNLWKKT
jgi:hypothetical protein